MELRKKMADMLSMNHQRASGMDPWTIYGAVHSVTDSKYSTNPTGCYLNVNDSTPVFTSYSVIMCN